MGYKISSIYVGQDQVRPNPRPLLDETDFKNSTFSKNGYLQATGWGNATSFSNTAYDTTNGRIYSSGSHSYAGLSFAPSAYDIIGNAKKIKIVFDYLFVANNTNTYASGVIVPRAEFGKRSSGLYYVSYFNTVSYSPVYTDIITYAQDYSGELIYDLENDTGTMSFKDISNDTTFVSTLSGIKQYWNTSTLFSSTRSVNKCFGGQLRDQGTTSYCGDIHIYYKL